ncbi:hypothetical protein RJ639_025606 [Escallonia herrerae]|uniref:Calcineurin-like phosphoesterase domain-containing protein n=1 Tax=Escallonia herrerae TaxID=1293975 RepID=A0AA88RVX2_9ASTE|nr:hypothetical protein RJ639_025606 [Escallonia herrerae]
MGLIGKELDIDFVISTGDKFYDDGLRDVDDAAFEESFTKYTGCHLLNLDRRVCKDLGSALQESNAKWKIVVGHHTLKSAGHHGNTKELIKQLLPVIQENNVDLYINGHDHCLEHITSPNSPLQFLTSGGGSKAWRGDISWWNPNTKKFYYDGQGFMAMQITMAQVDIIFYDIFGSALHKWSTSKSLYSGI